MVCSYCQKVELTTVEAMSSKKGCMFCAIDTAINMARATGMKVNMPKPYDYGRTQEEYDTYMDKAQQADSRNLKKATEAMFGKIPESSAPTNNTTIPRPGQPHEYSQDHIGNLLRDFDPDEPPHEYEEILSDDFFIKASVPGPLNDKMDALIRKEIKRLFTMIVYLKTQGSAWERYFKDPDEPQGPQGAFPPMG